MAREMVSMGRTSGSLGAQLLGDAALALLLVRSLSLDGGVSLTLHDGQVELWLQCETRQP